MTSVLDLGDLELSTHESICFARTKLKAVGETLGLGSIAASRVATVTSELGRRMLAHRYSGRVVVSAEMAGRALELRQLRMDFHVREVQECTRLVRPFFDRVSTPADGLVRCWVAVSGATTWDRALLERASAQLCGRSRAELMNELAAQNRELESHRAELENTVASRTAALRQAMDRAEHANRAKSEFLSHMSHELRTPLNGVLGHAQILLRSREVSEQQRKSLAAIDSSGRHLLTLINDILDLSKIEAGEIDLDDAPCDLEALMLDVCNIVKPRTEKRGVVLRSVIAPGVPRAIITDPTRLRQCLVNIAGNAAKFTEQGSIELRISKVNDALHFEVEDTGVGMSSEELAGLFQPFKQAHAGRAAGGTGLGLAISKRLIGRLGGELHVTSELGHGSTFQIVLPCIPAPHAYECAPEQKHDNRRQVLAEGQHCAVLIVDDNETNRDVLTSLLGPAGFELGEAVDGVDALEQMRARNYDLVLMDLRMPRMTGNEALAHIRSDPTLTHTKVMAVTASIETQLMAQLEEEGFDSVLGKPFVVDVLFRKIQELTQVEWAPQDAPGSAPEQSAAQAVTPVLSSEEAQRISPLFQQALVVGDLHALEELAAKLETEGEGGPAALFGRRVRGMCELFDLSGLEGLGRELERSAAAHAP